MSTPSTPRAPAERPPAPGLLWSRFGWFGSQIGGTLWLLLLAGLLALVGDPQAGLAVALVFLVANLIGWRLWIQRRARRPLVAYTRLLVAQALAALLGLWIAISSPALEVPLGAFAMLLVFPLMGLMLRAVDRSGRRAHERFLARHGDRGRPPRDTAAPPPEDVRTG